MKMNKAFAVLALLLIATLLLQGCAKKEAPGGPEETSEVDEDFSDMDDLEEELSMDELEGLDKELEELDW